jgi:MoaA/NifB/PqqE/SkfB family radical SAM enzyme
MRGTPLATEEPVRLLRIVKTSGAKTIVFAGGDPSLRADISELVNTAQKIGLDVEIQTNAHFQPQWFLDLLASVDLVGLSIDAYDPQSHDDFRGRKGNFDKVIRMLDFLAEKGVPVIIRSLLTTSNHESIPQLGEVLKKYQNIVRWSLLEFTAIGEGFQNQLELMHLSLLTGSCTGPEK